jgi:catechol 2,3-dioxygenase-like lactoylglutathione lyase family enzyme
VARVVGIGGVFFRARDPDALREWYVKHLGIEPEEHGSALFEGGHTVWAILPDVTE